MFVTKLNLADSGATAITYSTNLTGQFDGSCVNSIAVDASGLIYAAGEARLPFPTTPNAYQAANVGQSFNGSGQFTGADKAYNLGVGVQPDNKPVTGDHAFAFGGIAGDKPIHGRW